MPDFEAEVRRLLGLGVAGPEDPAWGRLEAPLGTAFPDDYKRFVDSVPPCLVNGKLYILRPGVRRWGLDAWVVETTEAFRNAEWADLPEPIFAGPTGLIPCLSSDEGHVVFVRRDSSEVVVHVGDGDCPGYAMGFSEWMYRFLTCEDMLGEDTAYDYSHGVAAGLPGTPFIERLP
ncbi:hypothetical protein OG948_60320 (plasmid) [Embleya sp. NBC_00888]|uniref:hypothetical protein n=1 Tax=Embleya sp. NBC_00888 TaxID=2975960 RepID=UPI003870B679|nr:hypothetical protein OG948_60320 [Embleya sp. NBC_00888]